MSRHNLQSELQEAPFSSSYQGRYIPGTGFMEGHGTALPTAEGWAPGATFQVISSSAAALYKNDGTSTTASWTAVSLEGGQEDFGTGGIKTDVISESSSGVGVTIDTVLLKDGEASVNAINALDASLGILGLAAAQGGAIALSGGTSSTSGNAGGAVTAAGGVGGATGLGGAVTLTGGASAGVGGTGGSVNLASGAATGGTEGSVNVQTVATGKLGFFGGTAVVKQSAYTQTFATADKTHSAATQQTVTAVANVTGATENYEFQDSSATVTQAEYRVLAKTIYLLFGQVKADLDDVKRLCNSIIDDGQAYGLLA